MFPILHFSSARTFGKLQVFMGNWAYLLWTLFFFLLFWHTRQEIGLSFQHCFQKLDFYGWEFSLKMITFGSTSRKGDRREGSIRGTEIFFSSICRKPACKTNIMGRMKKIQIFETHNKTPPNFLCAIRSNFLSTGAETTIPMPCSHLCKGCNPAEWQACFPQAWSLQQSLKCWGLVRGTDRDAPWANSHGRRLLEHRREKKPTHTMDTKRRD